MSGDLSKELQEVIKKNMPAAIGEELQGLLANAKENEAALKNTERNLRKSQADAIDYKIERDALKIDAEAYKEAKDMKDGVEKQILEIKLAEAEKRGDAIMELARVVFKTHSIQRSKGIYEPGTPHNNYVEKNTNITETESHED